MLKFLLPMLFFISCVPCLAAGTPSKIQLSSQVVFGLQNQYPDTIFQYQEPFTTTAQYQGSTIVSVPANTFGFVINTATLFPAFALPVCYGLAEITNPSLAYDLGLSVGGPRIAMAAAGYTIFRTRGGSPVFYIDNPSLTNALLIRVFGLSN